MGLKFVTLRSKKLLGMRSGKLYRSFTKGQEGSLTKIATDENGIVVTIGSDLPYAEIQNRGGFIKASPVTVMYKFDKTKDNKMGDKLAKPRETYQMAQYFWAKWFESNKTEDWLMFTALKINKLGGMQIKATHYFDNAEKTYQDKYEMKVVKELLALFEKDFKKIDSENDLENQVKNVSMILKNFAKKIPNFFLLALAENMEDRKSDEL